MSKFMRITLAIGLAVGLAASQAQATKKIQGATSKCVKTMEAELLKAEKAVIALFQKCEQGLEKCLQKTGGADRDECRDKVAGKACSAAVIGLGTTDKAGSNLVKMKAKIDGKCNPAVVDDPEKLNDADVLDIDPTALNFDAGDPNSVYGAGYDGSFFFESACVPATSADIDDCAQQEVLARIKSGIASMNPRSWALLNAAGVSNVLNIGELGVHNASGTTTAALKLFDGTMFNTLPLSPAFSTKLRFGSPVGDVVPITALADDAVFASVTVSGNIVCIRQPNDGAGKLCCGTTCPAMGAVDYVSHQAHDSSGNNAGDNLIGGFANSAGIIPDDPTCDDQVLNTHMGLTAASPSRACLEDEARIGACNQDTIGSLAGGGGAHFPVCLDGARAGFPCNPSQVLLGNTAVDECGAGASDGCQYPCPGCFATGGPNAFSVAPMCNSPVKLVSGGATAANGDMALGIPIQFTIFPATLSSAFDGPDNIVCTDDDTAPAGEVNSIITTTGTAQAKVYDQNGIPYLAGANPGGINASLTVAGAKTDCATIASSVLTGTVSAGAFSANDGALGDTTTTVQLAY